MTLRVVGCNYKTAPVEIRERVAFDQKTLATALDELQSRYVCEVAILSTCNRVEVYVAPEDPGTALNAGLVAHFLADIHNFPVAQLTPHLFEYSGEDAVRHLFRVVASLDSLIIGEGQIAGQVKQAYEFAHEHGTVGTVLHALFQHAQQVAKRVRTETGIARGHVSVSSVAVDYVREVFEHFGDKTVLVIGAGKMGELTLRHLRRLQPQRILVANRSHEKAMAVADGCGGVAIPWEQLDDALIHADIVLSTTGAPEPIVTQSRYNRLLPRRAGRPMVILDIAVPRDFDPRIHDGDQTCLFNIDDLHRIRDRTLRDRQKHVPACEAIIEEEVKRYLRESVRRRHAPTIARLTKELESKRRAIVQQLFARMNGRLTPEDRAYIEGAFRLLQNQFLHAPISAITGEAHESGTHTLLEALRKLFRLED